MAKKKKKASEPEIDIKQKFENVKVLLDTNRPKEAIAYIEKELNITVTLSEFKKEKSLLDVLSGLFNEKSFYVGKGIGSALTQKTRADISIQT